MKRIAFRLRVHASYIQEYEETHQRVWPELLHLLKEVGISQYSIFRHGTDLFFYLQVENFDLAWSKLDQHPVNQRWQQEMSRFFEPHNSVPGERFPMMKEVFYLD